MTNNTPVKLWRRSKGVSNRIGKTGEILNFAIVRVPPKHFTEQAPYPVVIVQFEGGEKAVGQLVDWEEAHLKKGQKVIAVLRRISVDDGGEDLIPYGIKFRATMVK